MQTRPQSRRLSARTVFVFVAISVLIGFGSAFGIFIWLQSLQPHQYSGTVFSAPLPVPDFTLTTAGDQQVSMSDYRGQYVLVYFGYTTCPDICPDTLAKMSGAMALLGNDAQRVQLMMVSVDPERDPPEKVTEYVTFFDPRFVGVSGTLAEIDTVAQNFNVFYQKAETGSAGGYLVDHTASVQVIDPNGDRIAAFPYGLTSEELAADLRELINN